MKNKKTATVYDTFGNALEVDLTPKYNPGVQHDHLFVGALPVVCRDTKPQRRGRGGARQRVPVARPSLERVSRAEGRQRTLRRWPFPLCIPPLCHFPWRHVGDLVLDIGAPTMGHVLGHEAHDVL